MRHPNVTEIYHWILEHNLKKDAVTLDATCGNGKDTKFLAEHSKRVYAFDIQEEAVKTSKAYCAEFSNILFIHDTHAHIKDYVDEPLDAVIFNFGYLPGSDHSVMTKTASSLEAVKQSLDLLYDDGILVLAFYPHEEGRKEKEAITSWIMQNRLLWTVYETKKPDAPVLYLVSKPVLK